MLTTKSFIDIGKLNLVDSIRNVTFDGKNNLFDQILDIKSIPDIFSLSIRFVQLIQSQREIILKLEKSLETKCKDSLENKEVPSTLNTSARKDLGTFTRIPSVLIRDSPISNIAITDVYRETTSSSSTPSIKFVLILINIEVKELGIRKRIQLLTHRWVMHQSPQIHQ